MQGHQTVHTFTHTCLSVSFSILNWNYENWSFDDVLVTKWLIGVQMGKGLMTLKAIAYDS